jgi:5-methyltetrahydrofolate--homocysteine methyltransferase
MECIDVTEQKYLESLKEGIVNLDFDTTIKTAKEAMEAGVNPIRAITNGLAEGLWIVGEKFERKEYFLSELVVAAEVMKEATSIIQPYIKEGGARAKGRVVLATVQGDNHDIGKSLVATLLRASGFEVVDLGVDVPTPKIVEAVKEEKPEILGLSALLTVTMPEMGEVIKGLKAAGLREHVKIIVGGSPVTKEFAEKIGADYRAADAVDGVNKCVEWMGSKRV